MPTKDGFDLNLPLPLYPDNESEQHGIANEPEQQLLLKASILVAIAAAISIAIVSVGNPVKRFADATASAVDKPALQPGADQSTPPVQSIADAEALPPTGMDAPSRDEIAAASEPAAQNQPEISEPSSEALFRAFQAWAAEKDMRAQVEPVEQPVQDAAAKPAGNARASLRLSQKHQHVRPVHNARAETRPVQNPQKKIRRQQNARVAVRSAQEDARAQDQSMQNPFLQIFGWRN